MAVTEIGESGRKAVWEKDNELRFRDVEFGESGQTRWRCYEEL